MRPKRMLVSMDKHQDSSWIHTMQFAYFSEIAPGYILTKETFSVTPEWTLRIIHNIPLFKFILHESTDFPGYVINAASQLEYKPCPDPRILHQQNLAHLQDAIDDVGLGSVEEVALFLEAFKSSSSSSARAYQLSPGMLSSIFPVQVLMEST